MSVTVLKERRWIVDDFVRVSEGVTGDEKEPVVFLLEFKAMPLTRKQVVALRDAFNTILADVPEGRIKLLG